MNSVLKNSLTAFCFSCFSVNHVLVLLLRGLPPHQQHRLGHIPLLQLQAMLLLLLVHHQFPPQPQQPHPENPACWLKWLLTWDPLQLVPSSDMVFPACCSVVAQVHPPQQQNLLHRPHLCNRLLSAVMYRPNVSTRYSVFEMYPSHTDTVFFSDAEFTQCLEKADLPSCTWYLEQLKAVSVHCFGLIESINRTHLAVI